MEYHTAGEEINGTGNIGTDCFTYNFDEPITLSFAIDDNITAYYKTFTDMESGTIVAAATRDTDSEYVVLEARTDYKLCADSSFESNATQTLFIRIVEDSNSTSDAEPKLLSSTYTDNRQRLISSKDCPGCNLAGVNLGSSRSSPVNLSHANLYHVFIYSSNLSYANLHSIDLSFANLSHSDLSYLMSLPTQHGAKHSIDLSDANLTGADLSSATWIDGMKICKYGSIGECK